MIDDATKTVVALRVANIEIYCFMENSQQQILSEIKSLMASVRNQLEELDAKIAQWQQMVEPEEVIDVAEVMDFDLDNEHSVSFDDLPFFDDPEQPVVEEPTVEVPDVEDPVVEELTVEEPTVEEPAVDEPLVDEPAVDEPAVEETVFAQTVFEENPLSEPAHVLNDVHAAAEKTAVIDAMTQKHAWRTAMPGAPVKDIRGAIALMDRVLFINTLFGTDPMAFQDALTSINQMQTLDQAVEYLAAAHPEWDFDSDVVYSFMMAVRRKVNS